MIDPITAASPTYRNAIRQRANTGQAWGYPDRHNIHDQGQIWESTIKMVAGFVLFLAIFAAGWWVLANVG